MYRVEDSHEAIIPQSVFDAVQVESSKRALRHHKAGRGLTHYPFTGMLECACCRKHYRRKVTNGGPIWICGTYNSLGKAYCISKQIPEPILISVTCTVLNIKECTEEALYQILDSILVQNGNGSAKLQKRFTVDFLQKKMKVNEGEVPQYYVENSHEAYYTVINAFFKQIKNFILYLHAGSIDIN